VVLWIKELSTNNKMSWCLIRFSQLVPKTYMENTKENKLVDIMWALPKRHKAWSSLWVPVQLDFIYPFSTDIKIHILITELHTFRMELVMRICLNIKTSYPWWSLPLFSSHECLQSSDNVKEKFHFHHC